MGEIKFGLVSEVDAAAIMKTLDLVCDQFPDETIAITEVGLYNCQSSTAMHDYILSKGRAASMTGIDNEKDKLIHPPGWMKFIRGNSNEVYNKVQDGSQHFIFLDGNHSFPMVVSDWFCYSRKAKVGGYIGLHDTSPQAQGIDWQRMGSKDDLDMYISVSKALAAIGISEDRWELVFNEFDPADAAGGVCIFKKLY